MEQVPLGDSGLTVSRVGLGCNNFGGRIDKNRSREVVDAAFEVGITFFDTARMYGGGDSEAFLGEILEGRRDRAVLATKFGLAREDTGGLRRGSAEYMRRALAESLARLRTDYIDLYYLHEPDPETPLVETLGAMQELVDEGVVCAIGCSNFSAEQLREAEEAARAGGRPHFSAVQNEYSLLERREEETTLPLCREYGIGFVPYFPLASGLLTGKYERDRPAPEGTRLAGWGRSMRSSPGTGSRSSTRSRAPAPASSRLRSPTRRRAVTPGLRSQARAACGRARARTPPPVRGGSARTTSPRSRCFRGS